MLIACQNSSSEDNRIVNTVNGPVDAEELQVTLTHEHIMSNFGIDIAEASQYDEAALFNPSWNWSYSDRSLAQTIIRKR